MDLSPRYGFISCSIWWGRRKPFVLDLSTRQGVGKFLWLKLHSALQPLPPPNSVHLCHGLPSVMALAPAPLALALALAPLWPTKQSTCWIEPPPGRTAVATASPALAPVPGLGYSQRCYHSHRILQKALFGFSSTEGTS